MQMMTYERRKNMAECFHCGSHSVIWDNDFTYEDVGLDGEGIVQMLHCANCGAEIEYRIPVDAEASDGEI